MSFPDHIFRGARLAVVGLGRNGLPVARALVAMGAEVTAWDDSPGARNAATGLNVALPDMARTDALILSPGIPHRLPAPHPVAAAALAAGVPVLSDAEILFRAVRATGSRARFAGITGTNGKSTTTALLTHMLERAGVPVAAGGNLGTPALALPLLPSDGVYVLEMSSYMLERLATLRFAAAAMLNLSPDHLDRHGDMAGYAAAKRAIFDRQRPEDVAVVGVDDPDSAAVADGLSGPRVTRIRGVDGWTTPALPGAHNAQNVAAAAALARALGLTEADIIGGVETFPGLPHRQERVAEVDGITLINDSKATNADAAARALACHDRVIWIAGGVAKAGGIGPLAPLFSRVAYAALIGQAADVFAETLAGSGVPHAITGTLDRAVPVALSEARRQNVPVVLLSPACASFDQFRDFEARGDAFRTLATRVAMAA